MLNRINVSLILLSGSLSRTGKKLVLLICIMRCWIQVFFSCFIHIENWIIINTINTSGWINSVPKFEGFLLLYREELSIYGFFYSSLPIQWKLIRPLAKWTSVFSFVTLSHIPLENLHLVDGSSLWTSPYKKARKKVRSFHCPFWYYLLRCLKVEFVFSVLQITLISWVS